MVLTAPRWNAIARRLARWLVWAMLLAALAPAVSRALASTRAEGPGGWVELCTAQGLQRVALPIASGAGGETVQGDLKDHLSLDHCGYCLLAAERFAPLIPAWAALPIDPGAHAAPEPLDFLPALRPALRPAARGPPFLI
jgi:hypothetical protein